MILPLFVIFLLLQFVLLYLGTSSRNFVLCIISGVLSLFLGTILISEGVTVVYTGAYGFVANNTTSLTGIASSSVIYKDSWIQAIGYFFWMIGIYSVVMILLPSREGIKSGKP